MERCRAATDPTPRTTYLARMGLLEEFAVNCNNKGAQLPLTLHHAQCSWHARSCLKNSLRITITQICLTDFKMVDVRHQSLCIYKRGDAPARNS